MAKGQMDETPTLAGLTAAELKECLELGATLAEIKDLASSGFGFEAIASLASLLVKNRSGGGDTAQMLDILKQQAANQEAQYERTRPRENPNYVTVSPTMKPSGEQWAKDLKCDIYFGPVYMNRTPLTRDEVTALNRLQPLDHGHITKTDGTLARCSVTSKVTSAGVIERLTVVAPMRKEDNAHLTYPSIVAWATELANQAEAVAA